MNTYIWRKNFTATFQNDLKMVRGKLAFKTKVVHWLETETPVIILISIHSAFHEEIGGDLKMNAFISTIKSCVKGRITVLIADRAHIQTNSLNKQNNLEKAFEECISSACALRDRYEPYFDSCNVVYWHSYIYQDNVFATSLNLLKDLYQSDMHFRELLLKDAESTYTTTRIKMFPSKDLFVEKAVEDILEQCASILILANKGYRFLFYPGSPYASIEYVNQVLIPENKQISWVDVFLTIEKKSITVFT